MLLYIINLFALPWVCQMYRYAGFPTGISIRKTTSTFTTGTTRGTTTINARSVIRMGLDTALQPAQSSRKFHPSSRNINKAIISAFENGTSTSTATSSLIRLRYYLRDHVEAMNEINVITLLHRCTKYQQNVFSFVELGHIVSCLDKGSLNSQGRLRLLTMALINI